MIKWLKRNHYLAAMLVFSVVLSVSVLVAHENSSSAHAENPWASEECNLTLSPFLDIGDNKVKWTIRNDDSVDMVLTVLKVAWPNVNGDMKRAKLNGDIFMGSLVNTGDFVPVEPLTANLNKRTIDSGETEVLELQFASDAYGNQGAYAIWVDFDNGCMIDWEGDGSVPHANARITGGGKQITLADGTKVTRGFTLHCDIFLSNNLEVNWDGSNKWHIDKFVDDALCKGEPGVFPEPPTAPADTFIGTDIGKYNNEFGARACWIFQDHGEPGSNDMALIHIWDVGVDPNFDGDNDPSTFDLSVPNPCGTGEVAGTILFVPFSQLDGGNLQFHEDQPHK